VSGSRRVGWWPWALMLVVVVGLLAVGSLGGDPPTLEDRARALEETIRCPSCASQSVANSDAPAAQAVRELIRERLEAGDSTEEIRDYVASRYPNGRELLLDPSGKGFGALVWALPVVMVIVAVAALIRRFGDWRPGALEATAADRDLVAAALAERGLVEDAPDEVPTRDRDER
jgi:cytochrome c-type biogenesis protein CcmH